MLNPRIEIQSRRTDTEYTHVVVCDCGQLIPCKSESLAEVQAMIHRDAHLDVGTRAQRAPESNTTNWGCVQ